MRWQPLAGLLSSVQTTHREGEETRDSRTTAAIPLTCWLCALIAAPRRPRVGNEVAELVYIRLLGRQQRLVLLAAVATAVLFITAPGHHAPAAGKRRHSTGDTGDTASATRHGEQPTFLLCHTARHPTFLGDIGGAADIRREPPAVQTIKHALMRLQILVASGSGQEPLEATRANSASSGMGRR